MDAGRQAARRIGYSFAPECSSVQALPPLHVTVTEMSCSTRISCAYPVAQHKPGHARFSVVGRAHAQARAGSQSTQGRWKQAASSLAAIAVCESQLICTCMKVLGVCVGAQYTAIAGAPLARPAVPRGSCLRHDATRQNTLVDVVNCERA